MSEATSEVKGIDVAGVTAWFRENLPKVVPPLQFDAFTGGHSNITYKVTDAAGSCWVLRRPPLHHVLPTAHDMGREYKIIAGLGSTSVPVPLAIGFCGDTSVNGAPFYVMGHVPGIVLHDADTARRVLDEPRRRSTGESFIDVLADLHAVDPDRVGLGDLGKKEGYVARQLKRWHSQWTQQKTREIPAVDEVHAFLSSRIPAQDKASVVHGDYRLGNCITNVEEGRIVAVLDWEICTLGDPLADLGYVLATWPEPGESSTTSLNSAGAPSQAEGFPKRLEVIERYGRRSGRDLSQIDFYLAFSNWKSACIIEGVYARYLGGALGETGVDVEAFRSRVDGFAAAAEEASARIR